LAVWWAREPRTETRVVIELLLMMDAPGRSRRCGTARRDSSKGHQDVEMDRLPDVVDARVEERRRDLPTGVVDEDVESTELLDGAVDHAGKRAEIFHVGGIADRSPAVRFDRLGNALDVGLGARDDGDGGTGLGQPASDAGTDASAAAGDEGDLVLE
jgi:hypothetical protein